MSFSVMFVEHSIFKENSHVDFPRLRSEVAARIPEFLSRGGSASADGDFSGFQGSMRNRHY